MEACEEKREEYKGMIQNISLEHLVYIDESGIEMTICKDRGWGKKGEKLIVVQFGFCARRDGAKPILIGERRATTHQIQSELLYIIHAS